MYKYIVFAYSLSANTKGGTYVMITYASKENNLGPDDKISFSWVFKVRFLFYKAQLIRTYFLYPYQMTVIILWNKVIY